MDKCNSCALYGSSGTMAGSSGQLSGSSGHPRKFPQGQTQDQVLRDAAPIPFQGINDDQDEDNGGHLHEEEGNDPIQRRQPLPYPRVHQCVQRHHPVDNILGSIRRGVTTCSRLTSFCEFYSFVSSLEPLRVNQALEDLNGSWMIRSLW